MPPQTKNPVTDIPADASAPALAHFEAKLTRETDCWDVHATQDLAERGFVLVDVRTREKFATGHLPGAVNIPYWQLSEARLAEYAMDTLFVVYCAGPHCNGSTRGAIRLARLGRPVKEMIGGVAGWKDEGFELVR